MQLIARPWPSIRQRPAVHAYRARHVAILCAAMAVAEIAGGFWFGSVALIADGLHMSAYAGALLIIILLVSDEPRAPGHHKRRLSGPGLSHVTQHPK